MDKRIKNLINKDSLVRNRLRLLNIYMGNTQFLKISNFILIPIGSIPSFQINILKRNINSLDLTSIQLKTIFCLDHLFKIQNFKNLFLGEILLIPLPDTYYLLNLKRVIDTFSKISFLNTNKIYFLFKNENNSFTVKTNLDISNILYEYNLFKDDIKIPSSIYKNLLKLDYILSTPMFNLIKILKYTIKNAKL